MEWLPSLRECGVTISSSFVFQIFLPYLQIYIVYTTKKKFKTLCDLYTCDVQRIKVMRNVPTLVPKYIKHET